MAEGERFEHGSVLGGKTRATRVSSQWKSTVTATAAFKAQLSVPDVGAVQPSGGWSADSGAAIAPAALGTKHDAAFARVMSAAEEIFTDAGPFRAAFAAAMNEVSSGSIAALCKELRTEPQSIAALKRSRSFSIRRARPSDVLTKSLRAEIVAARNLLNADRAERAGGANQLGPGSNESKGSARVGPTADVSPSPPPSTMASGGWGEAEKALEAADLTALVADVSVEAAEWAKDAKAAVAATFTRARLAEFEADVAGLETASALFLDTPEDLRELL